MKGTAWTREKQIFCRTYLQTPDVERAEQASGVEDGYVLLRQKDVRRYLTKARQGVQDAIQKEDVVRCLCRLAFSRPNDAIALACGQIHGGIEAMDLAAVAEFKHREGQTEVKFLDRVRALQALGELLGGEGGDDTAQAFFQALEDAASVAEKRGSETVVNFSRKQKQVLTWWCAASPAHTCDALICDGAVRSGKTVCMALSFLCWATSVL